MAMPMAPTAVSSSTRPQLRLTSFSASAWRGRPWSSDWSIAALALRDAGRRAEGHRRHLVNGIALLGEDEQVARDRRGDGAALAAGRAAMLDHHGAGVARRGRGRERDEESVVAVLPRPHE